MIFVVGRGISQNIKQGAPLINAAFFAKKPTAKGFKPAVQKADIPFPLTPVPGNYYTQNMGYFCKKELIFEKATKIPFRFRLGSVQQCDWLEGKTGAAYYPQVSH